MLFFLIFPILSLVAFVVVVSTKIRVTSGRLGAGFVLWISYTALSGRLLSVTGQLDKSFLWLIIELLPVVSVAVFFRHEFIIHIADISHRVRKIVEVTKSMISTVWSLPLLALVVIFCYGLGLVANLSLPQTMDDSLTAYLARAGFWITSGSIDFFETSSYNFPLVSYPALPTLSTVRWIVLTGTDHTAALDQWLATLISATLIYAIGKRVRLSSAVATLIAMLWLLMPVTLLQSQMVLNDMVAMVAILTAILLSSHLFEEFRYSDLVVAFLAGFVAVGTKQTVLFMAPSAVMALALGLWVCREKKIWNHFLEKRAILYGSGLTLLGLFMSFPEYFFNQRRFGHPLGPSESFGYFADTSADFGTRVSGIWHNTIKVFTAGGFGDVPASTAARFPIFYGQVRQYYPEAGYEISRISGVGWFGFSVTLFIVFGITVSFFVAWKRLLLLPYFLLSGGAALYVMLFMYTRPNFSEAFSRYMLFPMTLWLIAGAYALEVLLSPKRKLVIRAVAQISVVVLIGVAATQGTWSFLGNGLRPLIGNGSVFWKNSGGFWNLNDLQILALSNGFEDIEIIIPLLQEVDDCVAINSSIAVALPNKFPLSRLFATNYRRGVITLNPAAGTAIDRKFLESGGYSGIVLHDDVKTTVIFNPDGLWSQSYGPYTLLRVPTEKQTCS